jgi:hypothetical protein
MRISKNIFQEIIQAVPFQPPEIGGILGGTNGVISSWQFDSGVASGCGCFYAPNVSKLNQTILHWQNSGIDFLGIFHTHFFGVRSLSNGDIAYINAIMHTMPECIGKLYFPIVVLPEIEMIPYLAHRNGKLVELMVDDLIIE